MSESLDSSDPLAPLEPTPPPRPPQRTSGFLIFLAWLVIIGLVVLVVRRQFLPPEPQAEGGTDFSALILTIQGQVMIAYVELIDTAIEADPNNPDLDPQKFREEAAKELAGLETGSVQQRLRAILLRGDLLGPKETLESLAKLEAQIAEKNHEPTAEERETIALLKRLAAGAARQERAPDEPRGEAGEPILNAEERQVLRDRLGWFGDLALTSDENAPAGLRAEVLKAAQKSLVTLGIALGWFLVVGLTGLIGLGIFGIGLLVGGVRSRVETGNGGGVYAETFAGWMALFLGLNFLADRLGTPQVGFIYHGLAFFGSLLALAWPVLRGVPWSQVRKDIGWTAGPAGVFEPGMGLVCYALSLPLLVVGVILFMVLAGIAALQAQAAGAAPPGDSFDPLQLPAHPIVGELAAGGWWVKAQILFLGVIAAPIVEETMFRGVLYRHLREGSRWLGIFLSVIFSGTVVSFLFAVIHPQGLLAVPVLMAMAYGFTIGREWRGSLIASMFAHGITNLVTMLLVLNLFS